MYKATLSDPQNKELLIEYKKRKTHDASKSWKILKNIIGKQGGNYSQKKPYSIDNGIIDNSETSANEFNNFFVSIGHNLANKYNLLC